VGWLYTNNPANFPNVCVIVPVYFIPVIKVIVPVVFIVIGIESLPDVMLLVKLLVPVIFNIEVPEALNKLCAAERTSFDLKHLQSVLFSSVWNDNDELFLPSEVWHSRNTAKDKPFNYEHECDDIIGHMINGYVVDGEFKEVSDNTKLEDLPDLIHVISRAVLYTHWSKEDKQERMDKILEEINDGSWFVSVECLFPDFDYVMKDKSGKLNIVTRNSKTAFLTKHLRMFNGSGVYEGCRIGRVPRNFIVSGKGLVRHPANKSSLIIASQINLEEFKEAIKNSANSVYIKTDKVDTGVNKMENKELVDAQKKVADLEAKVEKLTASLNESEVKKVSIQLEKVQKDLEAKDQEINALKASATKLSTDNTDLAKVADELIKTKAELELKLAKIEEDNRFQTRLNLVKSKLNLDDEKGTVYVNSLDKLTDKAFTDLMELQVSFNAAAVSKNSKVTETVVIDEKTSQAAAKVESEPNLVVTNVDEKEVMQKLQASISKYLYADVGVGEDKFNRKSK